MEATLWGRFENVEHFLNHGADKNLKDHKNLKAIDLASPSDRNEEERFQRSGREQQIYKEIPYIANRARKQIISMLKDDTGDQLVASEEEGVADHFFRKTPTKVTVFAPVAEYAISSPYKTIAHLERGGKYPSIAAMSGWSHETSVLLVSGKDWTAQVIWIANCVGHDLVAHERDQGISGQYHACHAEKQLIACLSVDMSSWNMKPELLKRHMST